MKGQGPVGGRGVVAMVSGGMPRDPETRRALEDSVRAAAAWLRGESPVRGGDYKEPL